MTRRALLVGIDKYIAPTIAERASGALSSLLTPVRDVNRLRGLLTSSVDAQYNWTQIAMLPELTKSDPSSTAVTAKKLWESLEALFHYQGSRDDLLFYFAGHGVNRYRTGVLATSDASRESGGVPMPDLMRLIQDVGPMMNSITVILDCCTSGMLNDIAGDMQLPINTSILTASYSDREAYEDNDSGTFSQVLCDGLLGGAALGVRGHVTVTSLVSFIHERMAEENHSGADQQPTFRGVLTTIPVLRSAQGSLTSEDIHQLTDHFKSPMDKPMMTHEHEGPDINGHKRTPTTPEKLKTPQMLEFDYFKKLQSAGLLHVDSPKHDSLFFASGYDENANQTDDYAPVFLTERGQAMWSEAKRYETEQTLLARRGV